MSESHARDIRSLRPIAHRPLTPAPPAPLHAASALAQGLRTVATLPRAARVPAMMPPVLEELLRRVLAMVLARAMVPVRVAPLRLALAATGLGLALPVVAPGRRVGKRLTGDQAQTQGRKSRQRACACHNVIPQSMVCARVPKRSDRVTSQNAWGANLLRARPAFATAGNRENSEEL